MKEYKVMITEENSVGQRHDVTFHTVKEEENVQFQYKRALKYQRNGRGEFFLPIVGVWVEEREVSEWKRVEMKDE